MCVCVEGWVLDVYPEGEIKKSIERLRQELQWLAEVEKQFLGRPPKHDLKLASSVIDSMDEVRGTKTYNRPINITSYLDTSIYANTILI